MCDKAEKLREEVDASMGKLLSAKPSRRQKHAVHHNAWALLKHCMQHKARYWLHDCLPSEEEAFAEAVDATVLAAVERVLGVSTRPSTYDTDTNPMVTVFLAELLHGPDPMAAEAAALSELGYVLDRDSFNATSSARWYDHFLNDARGPCLPPVVGSQIILPSAEHNPVIVDLDGDALMNLPAPGDAHWRVQHDAIAEVFRNHCVHDLGIVVRQEVDDLFQQAVPLGNTVPRDELKDLVPDAELSLTAFNVVTGSYDPRSLKSTLLECKTMRYRVKYTAVPRATAVGRFERSLLGDIQRGLAVRDVAWHNTEPGQRGPLRDILDMSDYTGMVFGPVAK
eukprot:jgi/Tetstr1/430992/TSEL_020746.t1